MLSYLVCVLLSNVLSIHSELLLDFHLALVLNFSSNLSLSRFHLHVLDFWQWLRMHDYLSIPEGIIIKLNYGYYTCALVWLSTSGNFRPKQIQTEYIPFNFSKHRPLTLSHQNCMSTRLSMYRCGGSKSNYMIVCVSMCVSIDSAPLKRLCLGK